MRFLLPLMALVLLVPAPPAEAQRPARDVADAATPRVHLVTTGGTIASGTEGMLDADALLRAVPAFGDVARLTTESFSRLGSSQIGPDHWLRLARRIEELYAADPALAGVVVTHGTDTMEETAFFLDRTVGDARPVVVTGAMRPPGAVAPEGAANLLDAVRVAVSPGARERGTLVVMNDEIFHARDVTKASTSRLDAFVAPRSGPAGVADPDRVVFHRPPPARRPLFELPEEGPLPPVGIVYSYGGADGTAVDAFAAAGVRGIVLASVGRGNLPAAQRRAAARAAGRGIAVVVSSRTGSGRVPVGAFRSADADGPRVVGAGRLNSQKARVALMLALAGSDDLGAVAAAMEGPGG